MSNVSEAVLFDQAIELDVSLAKLRHMQQLAPQNQAVMQTAAGEEIPLLLRSYVAGDLYTVSIAETKACLDIAATHLNKIQECGAHVVSFAMEPRLDLRPAKTRRQDTVLAHAATAFVADSTSLDMLSTPVPRRQIDKSIVAPLHRYLDWCAETSQSNILSDIYGPDQYSWHPATGTLFLHDIDPLLFPVDWQSEYIDEEIQVLHQQADNIGE